MIYFHRFKMISAKKWKGVDVKFALVLEEEVNHNM